MNQIPLKIKKYEFLSYIRIETINDEILSNLKLRKWAIIGELPKNKMDFIHFICDEGHTNKICVNNLMRGLICSKCRINEYIEYNDACKYFIDRGYKVLTEESEYIGSYKTKFNM